MPRSWWRVTVAGAVALILWCLSSSAPDVAAQPNHPASCTYASTPCVARSYSSTTGGMYAGTSCDTSCDEECDYDDDCDYDESCDDDESCDNDEGCAF